MSNGGPDYCRLLARDNTPIVTRLPPPEYLVVRFKECDYTGVQPRPPVLALEMPGVRRRTRAEQDMRDLKVIIKALERVLWKE